MSAWFVAYHNFAVVIAVQLSWFFVVALCSGSLAMAPRSLALGAVGGIPLGAIFDVGIGKFGNVFHYSGLELAGAFIVLNAILSYGLAVATVLSLSVDPMPCYPGRARRAALIAASLVFALVIWLPIQNWSPVTAMFLLGGLVVTFSEALCLAMGKKGYLTQLVEGQWSPILRIWVFAVLTGAVYELGNYFFPLWMWINETPTQVGNLILIVAFGYFVLFYPMFIAKGLLAHFGKSSRADKVI